MLPQVLPMLAVAAEPFDAPEYSFEIKYDGVRALAAVDEMGWRLWGRERADYTARYPVCRRGRWWTANWWRMTRTVGLICGGCYVGTRRAIRGGSERRTNGARCGICCLICSIMAGVV